MHGGVRQVEEERPVLVGRDELHRLLGVARGERVLVGRGFDRPCSSRSSGSGGRGRSPVFGRLAPLPPMSFE